VGHVVHSGAFGVRNVDALFFLLTWALCRFYKLCTRTPNSKLLFLHPVGSVGQIVPSVATKPQKCGRTIFPGRVGLVRVPQIACWDTLHQNCVFAPGVICWSRSAFWCIHGAKRRRTLFRACVGPCCFHKKRAMTHYAKPVFSIRRDLRVT
jgi:hypothetical protein